MKRNHGKNLHPKPRNREWKTRKSESDTEKVCQHIWSDGICQKCGIPIEVLPAMQSKKEQKQ